MYNVHTFKFSLLEYSQDIRLNGTQYILHHQGAISVSNIATSPPGMTHTESQVSHLKTVAAAAQRSRDDLHNKLSEVNMELELANQRNNFLDKQVGT